MVGVAVGWFALRLDTNCWYTTCVDKNMRGWWFATATTRFLFRQKLTHQRTRTFLTVMMKLKKAKNLDKRLEAVVDNAFYTCCPPERWGMPIP